MDGLISKKIHIQGLVQGVGFRPYIYRLALRFQLVGWVENTNNGVFIRVNGNQNIINDFITAIQEEAPEASNITSISSKNSSIEHFTAFSIIKSKNKSDEITQVSPDIAVCKNCLDDIKTQAHRINYPFTNCTNCGPRFTIIKDLPYDREETSMSPFKMCKTCQKEYEDILDRRFHAQPVACNNCGPSYTLIHQKKRYTDFDEILKRIAILIEKGRIIAIKGLGGFHLACDARNQDAVDQLRIAKNRDGKPFAVMCKDLNTVKTIASLSEKESELLSSWRRPIVLLKNNKRLAPGVSMGFDSVGVMLPYMPIHYQLFEHFKLDVIVLTSGNISDEPIIIDNDTAIKKLSTITDTILIYNRDIHNRTDDSVAFVNNNKTRLIRRSRSYVPSPTLLNFDTEGILATGAELVNCFAIGKGHQAILSQHIGDLKNLETLDFYSESIDRFKKLFRLKPSLIAHDLHPDYLSTKYAMDQNIQRVGIQHHHAHIASCMAEHHLDEEVIGVAFDGVGLGQDHKIWGGEFFVCDYTKFERISHFDYIKMPGGDHATKHPWRMAISYLYNYYGKTYNWRHLDFLKNISDFELNVVLDMLEKNLNCPETSSCGRLFDAVSALLNICTNANFHAEAPMRLEAAINLDTEESYPFNSHSNIDLKPCFTQMINDLKHNTHPGKISAKFHNTIINIIFTISNKIRSDRGINKVVLSGGSFQNQYILSKIENHLFQNGFEVFSHLEIPSNDGGIALGQLAIAARLREQMLLDNNYE